jgi:hypothetical protein
VGVLKARVIAMIDLDIATLVRGLSQVPAEAIQNDPRIFGDTVTLSQCN